MSDPTRRIEVELHERYYGLLLSLAESWQVDTSEAVRRCIWLTICMAGIDPCIGAWNFKEPAALEKIKVEETDAS